MRAPFYKESHSAWYCHVGGKCIRLAKGPKSDPDVKAAAFDEYHKRMAGVVPVTSKTTMSELCARFLAWVEGNRALRTHEWYKGHLDPFIASVGDLLVSKLNRGHVEQYKDAMPRDWSDTYRNGFHRALASMMNWASDRDLIERNPVKRLKRPAATPRESNLTDADWQKVLAAAQADFLDVLNFMDSTGCRPQELRAVSASHRNGSLLTLEREKSKGKRVQRTIHLNDAAAEIVDRLAAKYPAGPLFRGRKGQAYTKNALAQRFGKLAKKSGVKVCAYDVRHRFALRAVRRGLTSQVVGALLGHEKGSRMVETVYAPIAGQHDLLAAELRKATG